MKSKITVLLIIGFALTAGVSSYFGRMHIAQELTAKVTEAPPQRALTIKAMPISLNPEDGNQSTIGELQYVAGWVLQSDNDDFGGWSGLVMQGEEALVAINDQGNWLQASFNISAPSPFSRGVLSLFDPSSERADKEDYDAESLIALPSGYLVGFEQNHRIMQVDAINEDSAKPYETGVDFRGLSKNSGIEAMAMLPDNRLIMFAENGRNTKGQTPAWIVSQGKATMVDFSPPENYSPTDAAALPNGDVLLLLRRYSVTTGASAKILHITATEIEEGVLRGREIATLKSPLSVDNMEGLDAQVLPNGNIRLFLISDDNFNRLQRTLFMVFDWPQQTAVQ